MMPPTQVNSLFSLMLLITNHSSLTTNNSSLTAQVNSLFSLMLENEPSNHLHSIILPKSYLKLAAKPPEGR